MSIELEKAQIMFKLARKNNWGACYDRLEHFKRFKEINEVIKELTELGWIIIHKKSNFIGVSLNTNYKGEIIGFIENKMPHLKGAIN